MLPPGPPPGPLPACTCALASVHMHIKIHSTWQFPMGKLHLQTAMAGSNLAMFGLQSPAAALQAAIRTARTSAAWLELGRNKKHVRISRQSAMSGPLLAPCGANAAVARPPAGISCAAGQIHARSRDFANGPNETLGPCDSGRPRAPAAENPLSGHRRHATNTRVPQWDIARAQPSHP